MNWFLGYVKMLRKNPHSETLLEFKRFYDVSINDPELMVCCPSGYSYSRKAHLLSLFKGNVKRKGLEIQQNPSWRYRRKRLS
jgi:hypothetical protein